MTRSPSKGSHTGSGSRKPWVPPTTDPTHRGAPKPGTTLVKSIAPGTINAYGTCGTPFRLN